MDKRGVQTNSSSARAKDGYLVIFCVAALTQQHPSHAKPGTADCQCCNGKINKWHRARHTKKLIFKKCHADNGRGEQRNSFAHTHRKDGSNVASDFAIQTRNIETDWSK